jgi:hypothetical protein
MEVGCGNGSGRGLVSHKLLAGELTPGYGWRSHTARNLFFLFFFPFLSPVFLGNLGCLRFFLFFSLVGQHFVWIPFVFLLSLRDRDLSVATTTAVSPLKKSWKWSLLSSSQPA